MDRNARRDDRGGRRDETRFQRPRNERDRSRSPGRERRDDRRRDRSPPSRGGGGSRGGRGGRGGGRSGGPSQFFDHDNNPPRGPRDRQTSETPPPSRNGARGPTRPQQDGWKDGMAATGKQSQAPEVKMQAAPEDEDEEAAMQRMMGFKDFRSTKNTKVPGNDKNYAVSKVKKAEYRQYMNRVGGFNRPLSPGKG